MSDDLYEVAFSGQVENSADLANVKARVGKMFNADHAKIAQLFSGKRVVIKKNTDKLTAEKYRDAFTKAGAMAEVKLMSAVSEPGNARVEPIKPAEGLQPAVVAPSTSTGQTSQSAGETDGLNPPQTDPLGIRGDQIEDLAATIAPVGSAMQDKIRQVDTPEFDLSGLDVAPVGSQIGTAKKEADPPPPDTSGLSLAD